ncbi:EAL domain-containing protein [Parasulfuritortus cantonensis]|uniref:EAL domain-containing protein n=1 Tax=Parasulfuritortus cantonensis TaxID=2528202 RepID=A0A4R1BAE3_9PROT|nr:EAL domain-containing protein [Parasulfuritortus cantonensis]TCJ13913.1 EAL domain-containing protein [Parasulfuritortus cantonensis]
MSIYRQFWLAIIGLTVLAFAGSFVVSLFTARNYIEQQLYMKNVDNAASLALVLSQLPDKDPVMVELMISSQFDTGHYQEIVLTDPKHQVLVERHYAGDASGAPAWFVRMFPINAAPGTALVQDGWKQYGSIRLVSHSRFAYQALWHGVERLAAWFLLAGGLAGLLGTAVLRFVFKPLHGVVQQAEAIQERRFITVGEPRTPELRSVVVAMNAMVSRLKAIFAEEAARLDELRRQINHDALTDLANREFFMTQLREQLTAAEAAAEGNLALVRISHLDKINADMGHQLTDRLIQHMADVLKRFAEGCDNGVPARLNGADFVLLATGEHDPRRFGETLRQALEEDLVPAWPQLEEMFHIGVVAFRRGDEMRDLLSGVDKALAMAESKGMNALHVLSEEQSMTGSRSAESWRHELSEAIHDGRIRLERYPVLAASNQPLHQESAARMQLDPHGPWLTAGDFMPMALRLKLSSAVDMDVVQIALDHLDQAVQEIAVNLSAETIADWRFNEDLAALLSHNPDKAKRLWIEVPEYGAFRNFDAFRSFCHHLARHGCKLGIEHFGHHFGEIARLAELGLDYLKIDSNYVRDIDSHTGNQEFLRGLCRIAHNVGMLVIAEGVSSAAELATLIELGFDGATGQEITRRVQD